jgi:hypothetical protein
MGPRMSAARRRSILEGARRYSQGLPLEEFDRSGDPLEGLCGLEPREARSDAEGRAVAEGDVAGGRTG